MAPRRQAVACAKDSLMVMTGLWETWRTSNGQNIGTCTVITTDANELLAPLDDRMPVILAEKNRSAWLGEVPATMEELKAFLQPFLSDQIELWPVDRRIGKVKNEGAGLIQPIKLAV